eukprot:gene11160-12159_t
MPGSGTGTGTEGGRGHTVGNQQDSSRRLVKSSQGDVALLHEPSG